MSTHQSKGYFTHEQLSNPNFKFSKHPLLFVPQDKEYCRPHTMIGRVVELGLVYPFVPFGKIKSKVRYESKLFNTTHFPMLRIV